MTTAQTTAHPYPHRPVLVRAAEAERLDSVTTAAGDLLVVPPGLAHAFGAHRGSAAEALIVITPGVERFEYFRHVVRMRAGTEPREILLARQDRFDTHFVESPAWPAARAS